MAAWREYLALMETLGGTLEELTELERAKTRAVSQGDLESVEACMKREQAVSLTLRGLDQKRDKMLAALGLKGVRLRELPERAPEELALETRDAAEKLRRRYEVFQSASEVARSTLECNLRAIEKLRDAQNVPPPEDPSRQTDFHA